MLVLVASCYLICNLLNVIVTAWEFIDVESLYTPSIRPIYTLLSDLVSILTVLSCAVRLPIYYTCHARIRREINAHLCTFCRVGATELRKKFSRDNTSMATIRSEIIHELFGLLTSFRYLNTGNGFVLVNREAKHRANAECPESHFVIGTGFDRVVLQVAMRGWNRGRSSTRKFRWSLGCNNFIPR